MARLLWVKSCFFRAIRRPARRPLDIVERFELFSTRYEGLKFVIINPCVPLVIYFVPVCSSKLDAARMRVLARQAVFFLAVFASTKIDNSLAKFTHILVIRDVFHRE